VLTSKKWLSLTLILTLLGMIFSPACASATISVSNDDARQIIADNAALLAEIDALNTSLTSERAQTRQLILNYDSALSADAAMIEQYKTMNLNLSDQLAAKDKVQATALKIERAKGWGKGLTGLIIGVVVGAVAAH
jgi:hypothetical protein